MATAINPDVPLPADAELVYDWEDLGTSDAAWRPFRACQRTVPADYEMGARPYSEDIEVYIWALSSTIRYSAGWPPRPCASETSWRCLAISADLVEPGRIDIFERWESQAAVEAFRGNGPGDQQAAPIQAASVAEYDVADLRLLT